MKFCRMNKIDFSFSQANVGFCEILREKNIAVKLSIKKSKYQYQNVNRAIKLHTCTHCLCMQNIF